MAHQPGLGWAAWPGVGRNSSGANTDPASANLVATASAPPIKLIWWECSTIHHDQCRREGQLSTRVLPPRSTTSLCATVPGSPPSRALLGHLTAVAYKPHVAD